MNLIDTLVQRPALRSRNAVGYLTVRSWLVADRNAQIKAFKADKAQPVPALVGEAAEEIVAMLAKYVPITDALVTSVPCGHSRRPDCFGKRLAQEVARLGGLNFIQVWADRFCKGVSHPKEFSRLPPLEWECIPDKMTIVIDDVATSGWHLEEAVSALRSRGVPSIAVAWIGGNTREDRNSRQPSADGQADSDDDRASSPFGRRRGVWGLSGR